MGYMGLQRVREDKVTAPRAEKEGEILRVGKPFFLLGFHKESRGEASVGLEEGSSGLKRRRIMKRRNHLVCKIEELCV